MSFSYLVSVFALIASPSMSEAPEPDVEELPNGDPIVMGLDKAPEYKTIDDKRHPDYVRCRRLPMPGTRTRTQRICMKNREWRAYVAEKNRKTRGLVDGQGSANGMNQSKRLSTDSSSH